MCELPQNHLKKLKSNLFPMIATVMFFWKKKTFGVITKWLWDFFLSFLKALNTFKQVSLKVQLFRNTVHIEALLIFVPDVWHIRYMHVKNLKRVLNQNNYISVIILLVFLVFTLTIHKMHYLSNSESNVSTAQNRL